MADVPIAPAASIQSGSRPALPYLALAAGLVCIGMSAIFVRWANAPGPVAGFYRMGIAAALVAVPFGRAARASARMDSRHILFAALAGLFIAGDLALWNSALLLTNVANATLFGNTSPLWVGLGALVLFREKLRPAFWLGLLVALAGAAIILRQDLALHPSISQGDLMAMVGAFFYGMFFLATERARDGLSALASWWVTAAVSAIVLLSLALILRQPLGGYSTTTWLCFVALAVFVQVAGWLCVNYSLGHLPASVVSPTLLGQPVLTAILGVPLLGQGLSVDQIIGGLVVLTGILLVHRSKAS